jgi:hypothetical protein
MKTLLVVCSVAFLALVVLCAAGQLLIEWARYQ